jgi:diguanylate cyclase (GGDEF)-like protein/PAS domain S-box-containing protein
VSADARWDRDSLRELVAGRTVYLRDASAGEVPAPAWLVAASDGEGDRESARAVDLTHPDDRAALVASFVESTQRPGEIVEFRTRSFVDGEWRHLEGRWLNLLGHPEIDALLCVAEPVDGPPIDAPPPGEAGDHDDVAWMMLEFADSGTISSARGRVSDLLGVTDAEIVGRNITSLIDGASTPDSVALWADLVRAPGATATSRRRWIRADGERIWLEASYLNQGTDGEPSIFAIVWDITRRMAEEQELADKRAELEALAADFRLLADEVPAAVFRCDGSGAVQFHNARWAELVEGEGVGRRVHNVVIEADRPALDAALAAVTYGIQDRAILELRSVDGERAWNIQLRSVAAGTGERRAVVGSLDDVTDTVTLRRRAERDALTGLLNRAALPEQLATVLADGEGSAVILFIDMDGFKVVNDAHGHAVGDLVLVETARRLERAVRPSDVVVRFGGDEFVVICRSVDETGADAVVSRIEELLRLPVVLPEGSWVPDASIGVARPEPDDDVDSLLHRADLAMFDAKRVRPRRSGDHPPAADSRAGRTHSSE